MLRTQSCRQLRNRRQLSSLHRSQAHLKSTNRRWLQLSLTTCQIRLLKFHSIKSRDSSHRLSRQRKAQVPLFFLSMTNRRVTSDNTTTQGCSQEYQKLCRVSTVFQTSLSDPSNFTLRKKKSLALQVVMHALKDSRLSQSLSITVCSPLQTVQSFRSSKRILQFLSQRDTRKRILCQMLVHPL